MFTPQGVIFTPFLLSKQQVHIETYVYYLWEHGVKAVLFHVIRVDSKSYIKVYNFLFWFQVADTFDYMMTYNETWFTVHGIPITCNVFGSVIGAVVILKEYFSEKNL
jgi:hypothetical protein